MYKPTMQNCFLMPSRLKSNIILVLDRLQCVARVNCLVLNNNNIDCLQNEEYNCKIYIHITIKMLSDHMDHD